MERNNIDPSDSPKFTERQDGDVTLYEATRWGSIVQKNKGRSMTDRDIADGMVTHIDCTVSFTGMIVRTEDWDHSYDSDASDDTERMFGFTILPSSWPRDSTIRAFLERDKYGAKDLKDMLYKTYKVSGTFRQDEKLSWDSFEAVNITETNSLVCNAYWELDWLVIDVRESATWHDAVDLQVRSPENAQAVTVSMVAKTTDFNPNVDFRYFKGAIRSDDDLSKHGYWASSWNKMGQK
jgi:hypothetical protein